MCHTRTVFNIFPLSNSEETCIWSEGHVAEIHSNNLEIESLSYI